MTFPLKVSKNGDVRGWVRQEGGQGRPLDRRQDGSISVRGVTCNTGWERMTVSATTSLREGKDVVVQNGKGPLIRIIVRLYVVEEGGVFFFHFEEKWVMLVGRQYWSKETRESVVLRCSTDDGVCH